MTWHHVLWGAIVAVTTFIVSNVVIIALLLLIPKDGLLDRPKVSKPRDRHPLVHWGVLIAKNALGGVLIVLGIVMALPGVPGPGLVSILLGVLLMSIPGKHRLVRTLLRHPVVLGTINQWRTRFGQPALILEPAAEAAIPAPPTDERSEDS